MDIFSFFRTLYTKRHLTRPIPWDKRLIERDDLKTTYIDRGEHF